MDKKHAYLIMAHNEPELLQKLLCVMDDDRCDFYLHIDVKAVAFDLNVLKACVHRSNIYFIEPTDVRWGGDTLVKCELALLRAAVNRGYGHYHLLSGADLPLKTQDQINNFFDAHPDKQFLSFDHDGPEANHFLYRVRYYHLLQNRVGRGKGCVTELLRFVERVSLKLQKIAGVDRTKKSGLSFYKGFEWFSITHHFAAYVLTQAPLVDKYFMCSSCADELFLQTLLMNSPFRDSVVDDDLRYIDWRNGGASPRVLTSEDLPALFSSPKLWARKFSEKTSPEAVQALIQHLVQ